MRNTPIHTSQANTFEIHLTGERSSSLVCNPSPVLQLPLHGPVAEHPPPPQKLPALSFGIRNNALFPGTYTSFKRQRCSNPLFSREDRQTLILSFSLTICVSLSPSLAFLDLMVNATLSLGVDSKGPFCPILPSGHTIDSVFDLHVNAFGELRVGIGHLADSLRVLNFVCLQRVIALE